MKNVHDLSHAKLLTKLEVLAWNIWDFVPTRDLIYFATSSFTFFLLNMRGNFLFFVFVSGDLLDVFTLINSAINFVLYCIMSKKFRDVFREVFFPYIPCLKMSKDSLMSLQTVKTYV